MSAAEITVLLSQALFFNLNVRLETIHLSVFILTARTQQARKRLLRLLLLDVHMGYYTPSHIKHKHTLPKTTHSLSFSRTVFALAYVGLSLAINQTGWAQADPTP